MINGPRKNEYYYRGLARGDWRVYGFKRVVELATAI